MLCWHDLHLGLSRRVLLCWSRVMLPSYSGSGDWNYYITGKWDPLVTRRETTLKSSSWRPLIPDWKWCDHSSGEQKARNMVEWLSQSQPLLTNLPALSNQMGTWWRYVQMLAWITGSQRLPWRICPLCFWGQYSQEAFDEGQKTWDGWSEISDRPESAENI